MASIIKENGKFRAYVYVYGERDDSTFSSITKAKSWAAERETEMRKERERNRSRKAITDNSYTLGQLFKRYANEVSPEKKGARKELIRLKFYQQEFSSFCEIKLIDLEHEDIQAWIDKRLKSVKPSTVNRDLNLISHCLRKARKWRLMIHRPFENVERPENPDHRTRLIEDFEIDEMCAALGYSKTSRLMQVRQRVALVWLFAIETCMRCSEITTLTESNINFNKSTCRLEKTKNGSEREVPLSPKALELLKQLPKPENPERPIFGLAASSVDANFRKYRNKTTIKDMTFHDSRHEAITRLADSNDYNVFEVAAITGHKNLNQLLTYFNKSATQMAKDMAKKAAAKTTNALADIVNIEDAGNVSGLKGLIREVLMEQAKLAA